MEVQFLDLKEQYRSIQNELEQAVVEVMRSGSYIGGKYVQDFERQAADYLGVKYVIGCNSGTDALVLALRACNVGPGDEVITTTFSFFATAEAIASIGAIPVFVDINETDYNIDVRKIEAAVTERTKVILPVHIFGAPCDMDSINRIAKKHGLKVIEDAAQAFGSEYKGRKSGNLGDIGCFSFYPTKNLGTCGDGGMVTTNNEELSVILRSLREHGAGKNGAQAYKYLSGNEAEIKTNETATGLYDPYKYYNFLIGYNSRLDAVQAKILSVKLRYIDVYNEKRIRISQKYIERLTSKVRLPGYGPDIKSCWHQFVICSEYKERLCEFLGSNGIGAGTFYPVPLHRQYAFSHYECSIAENSLPVAERIADMTVCLPIYPELTGEQTDYVIDKVNRFYDSL